MHQVIWSKSYEPYREIGVVRVVQLVDLDILISDLCSQAETARAFIKDTKLYQPALPRMLPNSWSWGFLDLANSSPLRVLKLNNTAMTKRNNHVPIFSMLPIKTIVIRWCTSLIVDSVVFYYLRTGLDVHKPRSMFRCCTDRMTTTTTMWCTAS